MCSLHEVYMKNKHVLSVLHDRTSLWTTTREDELGLGRERRPKREKQVFKSV